MKSEQQVVDNTPYIEIRDQVYNEIVRRAVSPTKYERSISAIEQIRWPEYFGAALFRRHQKLPLRRSCSRAESE